MSLLETTDANYWASEFMASIESGREQITREVMITWFANAIEAGLAQGIKSQSLKILRDESATHLDILAQLQERDREIEQFKKTITGFEAVFAKLESDLELSESALEEHKQFFCLSNATIKGLEAALELANEKCAERDRQIQELQACLRNHHEQFEALRSRMEVALKAFRYNLEASKGDRKPDRIEVISGRDVLVRDYENLTHHQRNVIIEAVQRAIANEVKNLQGLTLKDFSYDDAPF